MQNKDYKDIWAQIEKSGWVDQILKKISEKINQDKVFNYIPATEIKNEFNFDLHESPSDLETIKNDLLSYMDKAINTQSPYFVNQLYGGAHPISVMSEWVNAFMNTSMATYEIAPLATMFEDEILKSLAGLMGWSHYDGLMVPGGSYANMMSLHLSRFAKNPEVKMVGQIQKNIVYISDQAHYSVKKAAHLLGYGENQVRIISSDSKFKMKVAHLDELIQKDLSLGFTPTLVVSTLGTTVFGAVDPILEAQEVCKKHNLWHHVDGAWGGPLVFSSEEIQKALNKVDSVTFDFHKLLGGTLTKAIFITNRQDLLSKSNSCAGTQYIFHEDEDSFFDTGTKAVQCGRKVDSLSLWMTWKFLGHSGYKAYVDGLMQLRTHALKLVRQYDYCLLHEPEYLNICFKVPRLNESSEEQLMDLKTSEFQKQLRRQLVKEGLVFVNYSSSEEHGVFIRLVLNHLRLNETVLDRVFKVIEETAAKLRNENLNLGTMNQANSGIEKNYEI
jgi:glutamate/tyrosine decarboxylase-like PLP-dependent enzyme